MWSKPKTIISFKRIQENIILIILREQKSDKISKTNWRKILKNPNSIGAKAGEKIKIE